MTKQQLRFASAGPQKILFRPLNYVSFLAGAFCALGAISNAIAAAPTTTVAAVEIDPSETRKAKGGIRITGRIQFDFTDAEAENANFDLQDTELRRAYLGVDGKFSKSLRWEVRGKIKQDGRINLVDAMIQWKPKGSDVAVSFGQFKTPMSLDESTSSRYSSTLERAAFTNAMDIDRRLGLGITKRKKRYTLAAGIFGASVERQPFAGGMVIAGRATVAPINKKQSVVHFGASARYRTNNDDDGLLRYHERPFIHISDRIVSTGRVADSDTFLGIETAVIQKNFWAAGEYTTTFSDCPSCQDNQRLSGHYIEAGAFFGGRKVYKGGKFNRPKVYRPVTDNGYGAISFVARYDSLDLTNKEIDGGALDTIILGADWWPTEHSRVSFNWFQSDATLGDSGSGLGDEFNNLRRDGAADETVKGTTMRLYYDF